MLYVSMPHEISAPLTEKPLSWIDPTARSVMCTPTMALGTSYMRLVSETA
jgi:hypothetical protein